MRYADWLFYAALLCLRCDKVCVRSGRISPSAEEGDDSIYSLLVIYGGPSRVNPCPWLSEKPLHAMDFPFVVIWNFDLFHNILYFQGSGFCSVLMWRGLPCRTPCRLAKSTIQSVLRGIVCCSFGNRTLNTAAQGRKKQSIIIKINNERVDYG